MSTGPADSAHTPNESKKSLSGSTSSFLAFRADGFADGTEADRPAARSGAGGALVAAVDASALGAATEVLAAVAIAADAALSVSVEADGTRLPEVRVPPA